MVAADFILEVWIFLEMFINWNFIVMWKYFYAKGYNKLELIITVYIPHMYN